MLKLIVYLILSCLSQAIFIDTSVFKVRLKKELRTFTFNGVLNPVAIVSYNVLEYTADLEIRAFTQVKQTEVIVNVSIKSPLLNAYISLQMLLISDLSCFEVQNNINISRDLQNINITSNKNLVHTGLGQGNTSMNVFLSGWKSAFAMDTNDIITTPYLDTNIYNIFLQFVDQQYLNEAWVTVTVIIMGQSLIPQCSQSIYSTLGLRMFQQIIVDKKQNFVYVFGITGVYLQFSKMRVFLQTNTIKVGTALYSFAYLSIDAVCFNQVAVLQIPQPPKKFQPWKIMIISIGGGIGLIMILTTIIAIKFCKPQYCSNLIKENQSEPFQVNNPVQQSAAHIIKSNQQQIPSSLN